MADRNFILCWDETRTQSKAANIPLGPGQRPVTSGLPGPPGPPGRTLTYLCSHRTLTLLDPPLSTPQSLSTMTGAEERGGWEVGHGRVGYTQGRNSKRRKETPSHGDLSKQNFPVRE